jgi:hypothetical protein
LFLRTLSRSFATSPLPRPMPAKLQTAHADRGQSSL